MKTFKEFVHHLQGSQDFDDHQVASLYFHNRLPIRQIANKTGRSVGDIYRVIRMYGEPNRRNKNHDAVISLADSGLNIKMIADMTGYTPRHVRNIIKGQQ